MGANVSGTSLRVRGSEIVELPRPDEATVRAIAIGRGKELARSAALGPFHRYLPAKLQETTLRAASGLDFAADWLLSAELVRSGGEPAPRSWELL